MLIVVFRIVLYHFVLCCIILDCFVSFCVVLYHFGLCWPGGRPSLGFGSSFFKFYFSCCRNLVIIDFSQ